MKSSGRQQVNIASLAVQGSITSITASVVTLVLGFARSVLLARFVLPEHFGVMTLAMFYIALASQLRALGLDQALIHRQGADEMVRHTYFALRMGTSLVSFLALAAVAPLLARLYPQMPLLLWVLLALIGVGVLQDLSYTQETLLRKDLAFRQLALTDVAASVTMTVVAPLLAWWGWGVWALVAEQISGIGARFLLTWGPFRRWNPKFGWAKPVARWFWDYGKPTWGASNLSFLADRFDDFWIGTILGKNPLGYYSRAYEFAHYPRRVIANPLVGVVMPVFARLQTDRLRLSQTFYRTAYVILRSGFLVSGAFALVMPEFIHLVIGDQWLPMLLTFRLMLIYALLDALLMLGGNMLLSVGRPQQLQRTLLIQSLFFVPAVIVGARWWGINGVALAADGMLVLGGVVLYRYLREVVDFSPFRLAFWPTWALVAAWFGGIAVERYLHVTGTWQMAGAKLLVFTVLYGLILLAMERHEIIQGLRWVWGLVWPGRRPSKAM